jgi:GrpB-like predicted nucleotidyltransferase (UPF0157 family)
VTPSVAYVDYDANYPAVFERLQDLVHTLLPGRHVEHIGSTSVHGLGGRPVLDSVVIVPSDEHAEAIQALKGAGFTEFPYGAVRPGLAISLPVAGRAYPVVLYIVAEDHAYLPAWRAFTAYMQQHPDAVEGYAEVKRAALAAGSTDAVAYQEAKTPFLVQLAQDIQTR